MPKKNPYFSQLSTHYLFPEIQRRKNAYLEEHPGSSLISLGVGDTTHPLPISISQILAHSGECLGTDSGYQGYGPEQGYEPLRRAIAQRIYGGCISPEEVFVSDGAKCDTGRLLHLFGRGQTIAVQDPTYPVYVDTSVISGLAGQIVYMPCSPDNAFFPDLNTIGSVDLIFFCSPNNPTGAAATRQQLTELVEFARQRGAILLYDSAYAIFIQDPELPRTIYEIPGAEEVAIEIGSFSKLAGFTGLRLGWTVVPKKLAFEDGSSVHAAWNRIMTTFFNGASCLAQAGGIACLESKGWEEVLRIRDYYRANAVLIRQTLDQMGFRTYGGVHAPYLWVDFRPKASWEMFESFLRHAGVVSVPGCGFGPSGEGYLRLSALGKRNAIEEALARLSNSSFLSKARKIFS